MSSIYYTLASYTPTASSAATGYPATNLSTTPVRREWRSAALPLTTQTIICDLGSSLATRAMLIWDTNILTSGSGNSIAAAYSDDEVNYTTLGTVTIVKNAGGRRASLITTGVTARYLKLTYSAASTYNSAAYASIGRIVVMKNTLATCFEKPFDFERVLPNVSTTLLNGRNATASVGEGYSTFNLKTLDNYGDVDYAAAFEAFSPGPVILDAGTTLGAFLVESTDWQMGSSISLPIEETTMSVREVV